MNFEKEDITAQIEQLHEGEYGDFKRKVVTYLNNLTQGQDKDSTFSKTVNDMKMLVQFCPNGDIEETRYKLLQMARELK